MTPEDIITGEKIQELADVYLGLDGDFLYNPRIAQQTSKHQSLHTLPSPYDNPPKIFCYTHCLDLLALHLHVFQNPFVLITHNSDNNVTMGPVAQAILACQHLRRWFTQNLAMKHAKVAPLPIGMANRQWGHGDIDFFRTFVPPATKTQHVYFYFNVGTNVTERMECVQQLQAKLPPSPPLDPADYKRLLSQYRFCICPEGNGYDTHRFWEALYLQVIPIVKRSAFVTIIQESMRVPMVVVGSWEELNPATLQYETQWFDSPNLRFSTLDKTLQLLAVDM